MRIRKEVKSTIGLLIFAFLGVQITIATPLFGNNLEALFSDEDVISGSVSGYIRDAGTGEALIGASVLVKGTLKGAATDVEGFFSIPNVEAGSQILEISYISYKSKEVSVNIEDGENTMVEITLEWEGVTGDEVTVTAQARGQISAINSQLSSNTISNVVSKDRIQDVPDVNAAETIGRLPGISIQRSGGEANKIVVRGLSPRFSTVTVNGVRMPSSGGDDRSVDLSLISSNMLDGIEVKKAITADMDADAVAGNVDLRLREAPEGLQVRLQGQGGYTQLQDYYQNYRVTGTVSNRLLDSKLGFIATFNADQFDRSADQLNASYERFLNPVTDVYDAVQLQSVNAEEYFNIRNRLGGSLVMDYQLPKGKLLFNGFYNRLTDDGTVRTNNLFNVTTFGRAGNNLAINESLNSVLTAGLNLEQDLGWIQMNANASISNNLIDSPNNYFAEFRTESPFAVLKTDENGNRLIPSDTLGLKPLDVLQFVEADSSVTVLGTTNINSRRQEEQNTALQVDFTVPYELGESIYGHVKFGGKVRWLDRASDIEVRSRGTWPYIQPDLNPNTGLPNAEGELLRCIYEQTGPINGFDLYDLLVLNPDLVQHPFIPVYYFDKNITRNNFLTGEGGDGFPIGYTPGVEDMQLFIDAVNNCNLANQPGLLEDINASRSNDYIGEERFDAAYVMTELQLGKYIKFIPGIRWEQDYSRFRTERFQITETLTGPTLAFLDTLDVTRNFNFLLPMVHLQVDPNDWLKIRMAYTESLARPNFDQYIPRANFNSLQNRITANNTTLRPSEARNFDLSASVYENKVGLFTVSGFYKTIADLPIFNRRFLIPRVDTLTTDQAEQYNIPTGRDRDGDGTPDEPNWNQALNGGNLPSIDSFENAPFDTEVWGVEFDWQTNFWYLPSVFKGIVLSINYTRMFSETTIQQTIKTGETVCVSENQNRCGTPFQETVELWTDSTRTTRAFDQPAHLLNLTLGYDYKKFSVRFSYLFQGDRFTGFRYVTTPITDSFSARYERWDVSVKQRITENLELYGNFTNLTSTPDRNLIGSASGDPSRGFGSSTFVQYYGFTMDIGVRLQF